MFYLETNIIIKLDREGIILSENQRRNAYTSILVIQEILKYITKSKSEREVEIRLNHLRWLHKNGIAIHWESYSELFALAYGIKLEYPLAEDIQQFYYKVIDADESQILSLFNEYNEMFIFNDHQLDTFNKGMRSTLNEMVENFIDRTGLDRQVMREIFHETGRIGLMDQVAKDISMEDQLIKMGFFNTLSLIGENAIPENEWPIYLRAYNGHLDFFSKVMSRFFMYYQYMSEIKYNDIADGLHSIYLYDRKFKIVTDDRGLRKLIKQSLGDRYAISLKQYLSKFSD